MQAISWSFFSSGVEKRTWQRAILLSRYPVTSRWQKYTRKSISAGCMFVFFFFWNGGVSNEEILPRNLFISAFLPVCANVPLWLFVHGCSSAQVIDASWATRVGSYLFWLPFGLEIVTRFRFMILSLLCARKGKMVAHNMPIHKRDF